MNLTAYIKSIDRFLLFFLLFLTVDKVFIKPLAILFGLAVLLRAFSRKDIKAPLFYFAIPVWAAINLLAVSTDFSTGRLVSFTVGLSYWIMSALAFIILRKRVLENSIEVTYRTLDVFFIVNVVWSLANLTLAMYKSGSINPYMLSNEAFGTSTGDYIKGVFMGPSYLNMFVSSFFAVWYLFRSKITMAITAVIIACLTTSNFAIIALIAVLLLCLVLLRNSRVRVAILVQLSFIAVFYFTIANSNLLYATSSLKDGLTKKEEQAASRNTSPGNNAVIAKPDTPAQVQPIDVFKYKYGKVYAFRQTYDYLTATSNHAIFGAGMGGFSSQLAERTADLPAPQKSRLFKMLPKYISEEFRQNHYRIFHAVYSMHPGYHSIRHFPNSFLNQIFGEYGIVGFLLFLFGYVYYVLRQRKHLTHTWPILALLGYFLLFDYLFEYLSVVVFFELFFLLDLKRSNTIVNG